MRVPERDMTEKHLEGYNDVFADVVNVLLFGGERRVNPEDLKDTRARTFYKADGKLHEQERDVSKLWVSEGAVISLIGFENQTEADWDMALRVLGYEGADYRGQLSAGQGLFCADGSGRGLRAPASDDRARGCGAEAHVCADAGPSV